MYSLGLGDPQARWWGGQGKEEVKAIPMFPTW